MNSHDIMCMFPCPSLRFSFLPSYRPIVLLSFGRGKGGQRLEKRKGGGRLKGFRKLGTGSSKKGGRKRVSPPLDKCFIKRTYPTYLKGLLFYLFSSLLKFS